MRARSGQALLQQVLLQLEYQLAVLRVYGRDCAKFDAAAEALHQRFIIGHDGVLVRHEVLEAVHPMLAHQRAHVAVDRVVPPGDRDVEGVVAGGLVGPAAPLVIRLHQTLLGRRDHEVDDGGGAAGQSGRGAGKEIVLRHGAHERQIHVRVRIDPARYHVLAAGVDHLGRMRRVQVLADGDDLVAVAQHIGPERAVRVDDGAAANNGGHRHLQNL